MKKTFNKELNPALSFIDTSQAKEEQPEPTEQTPTGFYSNPLYIEKKSRRLQLLLKPSTYEKLKRKAAETGTSINDLINSILETI